MKTTKVRGEVGEVKTGVEGLEKRSGIEGESGDQKGKRTEQRDI